MAYTASSQAYSATPASDLLTTLDGLITAVSGWSLVETWTSGSKTAKIWKSAVAQNGVKDFYVVGYISSNTTNSLALKVCETWDAANKKMKDYSVGDGTSPNAAPAATTGCVTDATGVLPDSTQPYGPVVQFPAYGGAFPYWVSVTAKRIIVATRGGSTDYCVYAGLVDNLMNTTDHPWAEVALGNWLLGYSGTPSANTAGSTYGACMTREIPGLAAVRGNFCMPVYGQSTYPAVSTPAFTLLNTGKYYVARSAIIHGRTMATDSQVLLRAIFPEDLIVVPQLTASVNGDTVAYDGKTWVRMSFNGGSGGAYAVFVDNSV